MSRPRLPFFAGCALLLGACATAPQSIPQPGEVPSVAVGEVPAGIDPFATDSGVARLDEQGAVAVEVTPLDLNGATDRIEFDVAMNTHSVDLSMDLASLSTLRTDTGLTVAAGQWDAPRGGHHVRGKLLFPLDASALPLLHEATRLTLTIIDLDTPVRVFEWELR